MDRLVFSNSRNTIEFACVRNFVYASIFLFFSYFYYRCIGASDLQLHIQFAKEIGQGRLVVPHFLYHLVILSISCISHLSLYDSSCLTLACCIVLSTIITERIVRHFLKDRYSDYFLLFVSVSLTIVSAIYFPFINKLPYLGVWGPNPWHNPTFIAAKPFVLLIFYLYALEITKGTYFEKRFSLLRISILLMICALIKPNFILAFIPASIVFCFCLPGRKISMLLKNSLSLLPVIAVLILQFLLTYNHNVSDPSSLQFCFFDAWQHHSKSVPIAILQAIAFPLAILAIQFPRFSKDKALFFSWVLFVISLLIFGLFCESGHRKYHANFAWTYIFCLNILFVYSAIVFLRWVSETEKKNRLFRLKLFFCNMVFLLHFFSGIYYLVHLTSGKHF